MKSRLEKLEEFADWACRDHLWQQKQCLRILGALFYCKNRKRVERVWRAFDFHQTQYRRWAKHREHFQILRKFQAKSDQQEGQFIKLMSVSEYCRKFHLQCCSWCEDIDCCDNTSEAKKRIRELTKKVEELSWTICEKNAYIQILGG